MESQLAIQTCARLLHKYSRRRPTVCVTGRWAGVDNVWEQKKLEARKMLENGDESHLSSAPMKIASDHFIQENGDLRSENALLGVFLLRQTRCPKKEITAITPNFAHNFIFDNSEKQDLPKCQLTKSQF